MILALLLAIVVPEPLFTYHYHVAEVNTVYGVTGQERLTQVLWRNKAGHVEDYRLVTERCPCLPENNVSVFEDRGYFNARYPRRVVVDKTIRTHTHNFDPEVADRKWWPESCRNKLPMPEERFPGPQVPPALMAPAAPIIVPILILPRLLR